MYEKIYEIMKKSIESGSTSGVNLLVLKDGKEVLYCDYGYRDIENKKPMSRDTIFRLYSQTKPVTAAAAILLASEGVIDLAADIADYLPEFSEQYVNRDGRRVPAVRHITVRDLLNMTSGLAYPDETTFGGRQAGTVFWQMDNRLYTDDPVTTEEFSQMMSKVDLCFEPGEKFMYGTSADILGALVERVSGMRFGEFLKKRFFEPLEMSDTDFYVPAEKADRLAKVYDYSENGLSELTTDHLGLRYLRDIPPAFESGGAGLCSTLDDYAKFGTMLLSFGEWNGKQIMPAQAVRYLIHGGLTEQQKPQLKAGWDWLTGYTYGNLMRVCDDESQTAIFSLKGEYGWDGWLGTFFSNEPACGITFLMGVQQAGIGQTGTLVRKLKNAVMSELC
ncbi:MAG: beta-lactamase family protein [Oscillospiraceae bacterium]|nr:beta-lactamase family protein [Oscillospiraceae bacterium]